MVRSVAGLSAEVAGHKGAFLRGFEQVEHAGRDELHGRGKQFCLGFGQGVILVGVHADAVHARFHRGHDRAVAGLAAAAEDDVRALVNHGLGGRRAPFGVGEGLVETDIAVVHDEDLDLGVDVQRAGAIAFAEFPNGRDHIGAKHAADLAALGHLRGQRADQEASLILREDESHQVGNIVGGVCIIYPGKLILIYADELDVGVQRSRGRRGLAKVEAHCHDHIVTGIREGGDILGIILRVAGLDVLDVRAQIGLRLLHAFPRRLVEGLVVNLADIGYQANAENIRLGAVRRIALGRYGRDNHRGQHCHN